MYNEKGFFMSCQLMLRLLSAISLLMSLLILAACDRGHSITNAPHRPTAFVVDRQLTLTWTPVPGAVKYIVYSSLEGEPDYASRSAELPADATQYIVNDAGLFGSRFCCRMC